MFRETLSISDGFIDTAVNKWKKSPVLIDTRGKNSPRPYTLNPDRKQSVITHITLFPRVASHYARKDSKPDYLEEGLSIPQMFKLYEDWAKKQNIKPATEGQYRDTFNTEFNLSFFKSKNDQCEVCMEYTNATESHKRDLQKNYESHMLNTEQARALKSEDAKEAKKMKGLTSVYVVSICRRFYKHLRGSRVFSITEGS